MASEITGYEDILDTRDIQERIDELEYILESYEDEYDAYKYDHAVWHDDYIEWTNQRSASEKNNVKPVEPEIPEEPTDEIDELKMLSDVKAEIEGYCEWEFGEALIRDSYFTEYTQDLVTDIGDLPHNIPSYLVIDWDATAANIQMDYTTVEVNNHTYYVRCC